VPRTSPSIDVRADGEMPVIFLTGEFDLSTAAALGEQLESLRDDRRRTVVLDLTATRFIDSTIINVLVAAYRNGLDFIIRGASGMPRGVLEELAMNEVFVIEDRET
jgi:anti-anti-sigma factor